MLPPPTHQIQETKGLDLFVPYMTHDAFGYLWLCTNNGLMRFGKPGEVFYGPQKNQGDLFSLAVPAPDGRVWLKQDYQENFGKLAYFDPVTQRIVSLPNTTSLVREFLSKDGLTDLLVDRHGQLWVGLHKNGLLRVNPRTLVTEHIVREKQTVYALANAPDGRVWFATPMGLSVIDPRTRQIQHYQHNPKELNSLTNAKIYALRVRNNGDVLVGFGNEIAILTPATGHVRHIQLPRPDPTGTLWTNRFVPDSRGNDYFSVGLMVFRLSPAGELQRLEFARPAEKVISITISRRAPDGAEQLWVNAGRRVDAYDLNRLRPMPPLNMVGVSLNGTLLSAVEQPTDHQLQRDTTGQLSLTMQEGDFVRLLFSPYAEQQLATFRYKLAGYDKHWIPYMDFLGNATYQLKAGRYSFVFNRGKPGGGWEPQQARVQINVQPPFWKTSWFLLLALGILTGMGYYINRTYVRRQKLRQELARKEVEANALRRLDEFKSRFFANVSHELRTPLTLLLSPLHELQVEFADRPIFSLMQRNGQRLLTLINQLLDLGKLEAGQMKPDIRRQDMVLFLRTLGGTFSSLAESRDITFSIDQNQPEVLAWFDPDKVEKIVTNLLGNAFKFTPPGGSVWLRASYATDAHSVTIQVADTGIGIANDQLPYIFNRFHQVDNAMSRSAEGTGIGLALVQELVHLLQGDVSLVSHQLTDQQVSGGTTFAVTLPIDAKTWASSEVAIPPIVDASVLQQPTDFLAETSVSRQTDDLLLIIDDNADIRQYLRHIFAGTFRILEATDGQDGLGKAIEQVPDMIICDLMMPRLDGFAFCRQLKTTEATSHIPVLMLTAKASVESRIEGFDLGADDYLTKPFFRPELEARVRNLVRQRDFLRQKYSQLSTPASVEPVIAMPESMFLIRLKAVLEANLSDEQFGVEELSQAMRLSRTQLWRKIKALTNQNTNEFIRNYRLQRADELLRNDHYSVAEVAFQVGISNLSYFARMFQEHHGKLPSAYRK